MIPFLLKNRGKSPLSFCDDFQTAQSPFSDYGFSFLYRIESGKDPIFTAEILYIEAWRDEG